MAAIILFLGCHLLNAEEFLLVADQTKRKVMKLTILEGDDAGDFCTGLDAYGIAQDSEMNVYVSAGKTIHKYSADGKKLAVFDLESLGDVYGLAWDGKQLWTNVSNGPNYLVNLKVDGSPGDSRIDWKSSCMRGLFYHQDLQTFFGASYGNSKIMGIKGDAKATPFWVEAMAAKATDVLFLAGTRYSAYMGAPVEEGGAPGVYEDGKRCVIDSYIPYGLAAHKHRLFVSSPKTHSIHVHDAAADFKEIANWAVGSGTPGHMCVIQTKRLVVP